MTYRIDYQLWCLIRETHHGDVYRSVVLFLTVSLTSHDQPAIKTKTVLDLSKYECKIIKCAYKNSRFKTFLFLMASPLNPPLT